MDRIKADSKPMYSTLMSRIAENLNRGNFNLVVDFYDDKEDKKVLRSTLQNASLHKMFSMIATQMNELGLEYNKEIQGIHISMPYTKDLFKEVFWKKIQMDMYGIESTTELTTHKINAILDVLTLAFGNMGIKVVFPSNFNKWLEQESKRY